MPAALRDGFPADPASGNVARLWSRMAADLRGHGSTAPRFRDGVAIHRVIAAIEAADRDRRSVA